MDIKITKLDLSRYNRVELEVLLDHGILSVTEFEAEMRERGLEPKTTVII
jgi:hypothetical protein